MEERQGLYISTCCIKNYKQTWVLSFLYTYFMQHVRSDLQSQPNLYIETNGKYLNSLYLSYPCVSVVGSIKEWSSVSLSSCPSILTFRLYSLFTNVSSVKTSIVYVTVEICKMIIHTYTV